MQQYLQSTSLRTYGQHVSVSVADRGLASFASSVNFQRKSPFLHLSFVFDEMPRKKSCLCDVITPETSRWLSLTISQVTNSNQVYLCVCINLEWGDESLMWVVATWTEATVYLAVCFPAELVPRASVLDSELPFPPHFLYLTDTRRESHAPTFHCERHTCIQGLDQKLHLHMHVCAQLFHFPSNLLITHPTWRAAGFHDVTSPPHKQFSALTAYRSLKFPKLHSNVFPACWY